MAYGIEIPDLEQIQTKFKQILSSKPSWQGLENSEIVALFSEMVAWTTQTQLFEIERGRQESLRSTAMNRSSILAHAEDRGMFRQQASYRKHFNSQSGVTSCLIPENQAIQ